MILLFIIYHLLFIISMFVLSIFPDLKVFFFNLINSETILINICVMYFYIKILVFVILKEWRREMEKKMN